MNLKIRHKLLANDYLMYLTKSLDVIGNLRAEVISC